MLLTDRPGFVTPKQFIEVALSFLSNDVVDLQLHAVFVAGSFCFEEHAERPGQVPFHTGVVEHADQYLRFVKIPFIVYP